MIAVGHAPHPLVDRYLSAASADWLAWRRLAPKSSCPAGHRLAMRTVLGLHRLPACLSSGILRNNV